MTLDEKYRLAYLKLGETLFQKGIEFKRSAFNAKEKDVRVVSSTYLNNLIEAKGFDRPYHADRKYRVVDLDTMKEIIEYDWVDKKDYEVDFWDCDNYAETFKVKTNITYGINSIALAKHIKVTLQNEETSYHRACIFPAIEDNIIRLYFLETQNDNLIELTDNNPFMLGRWGYMLNLIEF